MTPPHEMGSIRYLAELSVLDEDGEDGACLRAGLASWNGQQDLMRAARDVVTP
ncbi:hypothetical protein GCM10009799_50670 [Nocardiopsis rhodophaea]|uniref:Uncharacterized protein n=1 Tax=Nocardiopsis rhodophaea TaxID=280238 RepID=A0ABP5F6I2_9ACTN